MPGLTFGLGGGYCWVGDEDDGDLCLEVG